MKAVAMLILSWWTLPLLAQEVRLGDVTIAADAPFKNVNREQITTRLDLEKNKVMLGESAYFYFVVKNSSAQDLWVLEGGDYRNNFGRPDSFVVIVTDAQGKLVPQPQTTFDAGGMVSFQSLPANGEKVFHLFLPHWATFERPGHYTIRVKKTLTLSHRNSLDDMLPGPQSKAHTMSIEAEAIAELEIVPADCQRLGKIINELGEQIVALPSQTYSEPARRAIAKLEYINDERAIPWFLKLLEKWNDNIKFQALSALGKYNNQAAFEGLKAGFMNVDSDGNSNLVHAAAVSLAQSPYPEALPFLLTQYQHPEQAVRLTVTRALFKAPREKAVPALEKMMRDENPAVSKAARSFWLELQTGGDFKK